MNCTNFTPYNQLNLPARRGFLALATVMSTVPRMVAGKNRHLHQMGMCASRLRKSFVDNTHIVYSNEKRSKRTGVCALQTSNGGV